MTHYVPTFLRRVHGIIDDHSEEQREILPSYALVYVMNKLEFDAAKHLYVTYVHHYHEWRQMNQMETFIRLDWPFIIQYLVMYNNWEGLEIAFTWLKNKDPHVGIDPLRWESRPSETFTAFDATTIATNMSCMNIEPVESGAKKCFEILLNHLDYCEGEHRVWLGSLFNRHELPIIKLALQGIARHSKTNVMSPLADISIACRRMPVKVSHRSFSLQSYSCPSKFQNVDELSLHIIEHEWCPACSKYGCCGCVPEDIGEKAELLLRYGVKANRWCAKARNCVHQRNMRVFYAIPYLYLFVLHCWRYTFERKYNPENGTLVVKAAESWIQRNS